MQIHWDNLWDTLNLVGTSHRHWHCTLEINASFLKMCNCGWQLPVMAGLLLEGLSKAVYKISALWPHLNCQNQYLPWLPCAEAAGAAAATRHDSNRGSAVCVQTIWLSSQCFIISESSFHMIMLYWHYIHYYHMLVVNNAYSSVSIWQQTGLLIHKILFWTVFKSITIYAKSFDVQHPLQANNAFQCNKQTTKRYWLSDSILQKLMFSVPTQIYCQALVQIPRALPQPRPN